MKRIQYKKDYTQFLTPETRDLKIKSDNLLQVAIKTNNTTDWVYYKNTRNETQKRLREDKKMFLKGKFKSKCDKWRLLQQFNGTKKSQTPNCISHEGNQITSPEKIAQLANNFFIDKINKISSSFLNNKKISPIEILSLLLPRNENKFVLPLITVDETKNMLKKLKNSSSIGYDRINYRFIQKIYIEISPHITHMINTIIIKGKVPDVLKVSRITPISKPLKPTNLLGSFRPLNNLSCLDKLWEEHLRLNLVKFLKTNNIIHQNHHGGRQQHSTTTALLQITNNLRQQYDRDRVTATLTTDLTSAFDTVNTKFLLEKLEYYGVRDNELNLFKSYFSDRKQFVEVNTFKSSILPSPQCSVIQG